ncbi:FliG C-terminal domain-containing protein, partial [Proteus terrae]|uniref:FliG C-terminal domain-containing protein n=1 Tax=Proteus terrae TaxID=1574161 RepID=UPI00331626F9
QEENVITAVRDYDGELAQKIIDEMFLFENLIDIDNRSIQRILKEVEKQEKEAVQQQKVLEQINMLDDMKDKAQKLGHAEGFEAG